MLLSVFILTLTACNKQDISQENIKKDMEIYKEQMRAFAERYNASRR